MGTHSTQQLLQTQTDASDTDDDDGDYRAAYQAAQGITSNTQRGIYGHGSGVAPYTDGDGAADGDEDDGEGGADGGTTSVVARVTEPCPECGHGCADTERPFTCPECDTFFPELSGTFEGGPWEHDTDGGPAGDTR